MNAAKTVTVPPAAIPPLRLALVFAVLFIAYQLPEGLGLRLLHSAPVNAALMLAFFPVAWLCGRALGFRGFDAWYMGLRPGWVGLLAATFALACAAKAVALGLGSGLGIYRVASSGLGAEQVLMAALMMLPYTFIPSVAEDIVTRGFLLRAFPRLGQRWLFVLASSALYVANHIYRYADGPLELARLFAFGLAYGAGIYYSRSLWAAIGLHWGWNFAGQFSDSVISNDLIAPTQGPLVSIAAHLLMLGVVVLVARARRA
ncbi:CPBP family intramembrane glutamic endopeptidase [Massilia horti]|uniref:CPBP family intramembrane metalloprotease n=1 Tax=Massilia horti TaxID=2562153 RepID=A0A4Y9T069_9BURK|nr:type II CAAX endopeptidase family protein [Massilia horti]TFW31003.1 CPBP family intramembrane metalloprotease [Massilia horti]